MIELESRIERLMSNGQSVRFDVQTPVIDPRMECWIRYSQAASQQQSTDATVAFVNASAAGTANAH